MNIGAAISNVAPYVAAAGGLGGLAVMCKVFLDNRRLSPKSTAEARNITAAAIDKDWTRFQREIGRLVKRCELAEERAAQAIVGFMACEEREIHLKSRVAELEAFNMGRGQSAQEAHVMLAAERIVADKNK